MTKPYSHILPPENISDDELDLDAYSYDLGTTELKPTTVLWPETTEQVARIMRETNQSRGQINIRGRGTSTSGSSVGQNTIILSSEKMNKVIFFDPVNRTITVQPGITVSEINTFLYESELLLPVTTLKSTESVGGLLAINAYFRESESIGRFSDLIKEFEFVDGTGKIYYPAKKDYFSGLEGLTGFMTRATIRLFQKQILSMDLLHFDNIPELIKKVSQSKNDRERVFLDFFDKKTSLALFQEEKYTLLLAYSSFKGKFNSIIEQNKLIEIANSCHKKIRSEGFFHIIDAKTSIEKTYDIIDWCEKNKIPLHSHLGIGVFYAYFMKDESEKIINFKHFLKSIGAGKGCCFGVGSDTSFVTQDTRKKMIRLKDEFDYNNTLNRGNLVQYR